MLVLFYLLSLHAEDSCGNSPWLSKVGAEKSIGDGKTKKVGGLTGWLGACPMRRSHGLLASSK